jgi:3-oxoacyl-[acyl-carrier protein] reductase
MTSIFKVKKGAELLLKDKNAVIYGAGGSVGGAVARAFAREGASVFLAGRTLATLDAAAESISKAGGTVHTSQVDALDGQAVEQHLSEIMGQFGHIDVSFNVIDLGGAQGTPLTEMSQESFTHPIQTAMQTQFLTATAAARHMAKQGSGVILALTAQASQKPYPHAGGFGVACSAIEGFCRQLASEVGSQGIRVICLRSSGSPDTPGVREAMRLQAEKAGMTQVAWEAKIAENTMLKRLPRLAEVANVAVLMASDHANIMTAAIANVTCGEIAD